MNDQREDQFQALTEQELSATQQVLKGLRARTEIQHVLTSLSSMKEPPPAGLTLADAVSWLIERRDEYKTLVEEGVDETRASLAARLAEIDEMREILASTLVNWPLLSMQALSMAALAREVVAQAERWRIDAEHYRGEASNATAQQVESLSAEVARLTGEVAATRSEAKRQLEESLAEATRLRDLAQQRRLKIAEVIAEFSAGMFTPADFTKRAVDVDDALREIRERRRLDREERDAREAALVKAAKREEAPAELAPFAALSLATERSKTEIPINHKLGEVGHFPIGPNSKSLRLRAQAHRTATQLREFADRSVWPVREALHSAASVVRDLLEAIDVGIEARSAIESLAGSCGLKPDLPTPTLEAHVRECLAASERSRWAIERRLQRLEEILAAERTQVARLHAEVARLNAVARDADEQEQDEMNNLIHERDKARDEVARLTAQAERWQSMCDDCIQAALDTEVPTTAVASSARDGSPS